MHKKHMFQGWGSRSAWGGEHYSTAAAIIFNFFLTPKELPAGPHVPKSHTTCLRSDAGVTEARPVFVFSTAFLWLFNGSLWFWAAQASPPWNNRWTNQEKSEDVQVKKPTVPMAFLFLNTTKTVCMENWAPFVFPKATVTKPHFWSSSPCSYEELQAQIRLANTENRTSENLDRLHNRRMVNASRPKPGVFIPLTAQQALTDVTWAGIRQTNSPSYHKILGFR